MTDAERLAAVVRGLAAGGNALLAAMATPDRQFVAEKGTRRRFTLGQTLRKPDGKIEAAYFIESGVASVIKSEQGGRRTEICLIGPEGFYGAAILLDDGDCPYELISQAHQLSVVELPAADVLELVARSPSAKAALSAAMYVQMIQIAENLVSAVWQPVGARLARWLLMYRERMRSDRIEVTHAFLAIMVGAQRTKVTAALHELEAAGAIVGSRGLVQIKDVALLQSFATHRGDRKDLHDPLDDAAASKQVGGHLLV